MKNEGKSSFWRMGGGGKDFVSPIVAFFVIIGLWELFDLIFGIREVVLPSPHEILLSFIEHFGSLFYHNWITLLEAVVGFTLGSVVGIGVALLFVYSPLLKKSFYPYAICLKATPIYALAPLLILWFGNDMMPKMVMSALISFFPVLVSSVKGFSAVSLESYDLFRSFSATDRQMFFYLRIPSALPYIFPALKVATTFSVVGATIAEFTGASEGIGFLIVHSSYYLDTSLMFAAIVMISISGVLFFYLVDYIEKRLVFWEKER